MERIQIQQEHKRHDTQGTPDEETVTPERLEEIKHEGEQFEADADEALEKIDQVLADNLQVMGQLAVETTRAA